MTRVLLIEEPVLVPEGLALLLERHGMDVVGRLKGTGGILPAVAVFRPDVLVVGCPEGGVEVMRMVRAHAPGTGVLIVAGSVDAEAATRMLAGRTPAAGYLLKRHVPDVETFLRAVRTVADGGTFVDPAVVERVHRRRRERAALDS